MPEPSFRGDPYRVLDVPRGTSSEELKRRWRDLAREHHPDRAVGDPHEQQRLTARMARINAAYDLLRDPVRRARYDASPSAQRAWREEQVGTGPTGSSGLGGRLRPARPRRPATAATVPTGDRPIRHQQRVPAPRHGHRQRPAARCGARTHGRAASTAHPTCGRARPPGPVSRRTTRQPRLPTLEQARACPLEFGRFHGATLGEVADREPTYVDWIARTITQHRDLVLSARVIAADLDARGIEREVRPSQAGVRDCRSRTGGSRNLGLVRGEEREG